MSELVFERAAWWPLALALPLVLLLLWAGIRGARRGVVRYGAAPLRRPGSALGRALRLTAIAGLGLVAWLDPRLGEETLKVERRGLDVVVAVDTSRSMLARDVPPNRLARAVRDVRSLLPALVGGDRVALLAFAGEPRLVCPPTHDIDAFRDLLLRLDTDTVPIGGTNIGATIRRALELVDDDDARSAVILLLTDGEDLGGEGVAAAAEAARRDVVVHTIGYGSTRGSKITLDEDGREVFLQDRSGAEVVSALDADGLRKVAERTGGEFVRADAMALPLVELKRKRLDPMLERSYDAGEEVVRRPRFQWVLLPAMLLLLVEIARHGRAIRGAAETAA